MELTLVVIGVVLGWLIAQARRTRAGNANDAPRASEPPASDEPAEPAPRDQPPPAATDDDPRAQIGALSQQLVARLENIEDPRALERLPEFARLRDLLADPTVSAQDRVFWLASNMVPLSCASLAAMIVLQEPSQRDVARVMSRMGYFSLYFALRLMASSRDPEIAGDVLIAMHGWWTEHPPTRHGLRAYLDALAAHDVAPRIAADAAVIEEGEVESLRDCLKALTHPVATQFLAEVDRVARRQRAEREVARVAPWFTGDLGDEDIARTPEVETTVATLIDAITQPDRPSHVLVGALGAGKTTAIRLVLSRLARDGWRILIASPDQVASGMTYIGELERRVEAISLALSAPRSLWFVPECHALLEKGTWSGNPNGLLDRLLPLLDARQLQIIGESQQAAWSQVVAKRQRAGTVLRTLKFEPLTDAGLRALIAQWAEHWRTRLGATVLTPEVTAEAMELARQHFADRVEPGRTLGLLKDALIDARASDPPAVPLDREALLRALARRTGLPMAVLDVERELDLGGVRRFFSERLIGQGEAVETLVDRIAMMKAGLTDPRRPLGVFLFAGPTGTGKTEIAKTLAEYLFGSPERMLRYDMSEYQSDEAYWRLIDESGGSLTARIREQPFAVVLLDEFEKSHPRIWDLFLQVFDDGRLTDRAGNTASFRHAIVILTSNVGSTIDRGGGPGFVPQTGGLSRAVVQRAIDTTFRREFINRIDRVVIFDALSRAAMRDILRKELRLVLDRRGFRIRDWAVEWEPSAIEFLLDRGFTADLGARPLRRAIERHFLAPLSRAIVENRAPSGEQFLFVAALGDAIDVRFVDPNAEAAPVAGAVDTTPVVDVRALALDPRQHDEALRLLARALENLRARLDGDELQQLKENAAAAMQARDFWDQPDRARVLDWLERLDRLEAGWRGAESLLMRLQRHPGRIASDIVRRLSLLLHVMGEAVESLSAEQAEDATLSIEPLESHHAGAHDWRDRLMHMYSLWAKDRGMRLRWEGPLAGGVLRARVRGFGAWRILRHEAGLHLLDPADDSGARHRARVVVGEDEHDAREPGVESRICRRYTDGGSPLVRDAVHGWRSGRFDRVMAGDFDLFEAE